MPVEELFRVLILFNDEKQIDRLMPRTLVLLTVSDRRRSLSQLDPLRNVSPMSDHLLLLQVSIKPVCELFNIIGHVGPSMLAARLDHKF